MSKADAGKQRGGFGLGLIVGLLVGLAVALGLAMYITKAPIPFVDKVPQRTAAQDAEEAERNRNWDPNAPLAGKGQRSASGVLVAASAPVVTPAPEKPSDKPVTPVAEPATDKSAAKPVELPAKSSDKASEKPADKAEPAADKAKSGATGDVLYFVQAGAFQRPEDAEQQRTRLALQGQVAKVFEKEQSGRVVYRVRMGPFDTRDEAESLQKKLVEAGFEATVAAAKR